MPRDSRKQLDNLRLDEHGAAQPQLSRASEQLSAVQRRDAVRARVAIRPRLAARLFGSHRKPLRVGITNVSAGGLQVRSQDELRLGETLLLAFALDGYFEELTVRVHVRRVQRHERWGRPVWDAGCVFEPLPQKLIDAIVQYVFTQLRAEARRRAERQA